MSDDPFPKAEVSTVALRDACQRIASHLRGELKASPRGYCVQISNSSVNRRLRLSLSTTLVGPSLMSLAIECGPMGRDVFELHLSYQNIAHLYITWDTPRHVSFCYVQECHFYVINVGQDLTVSVCCDRDRRLDTPEVQSEAASQRRAFHHLGAVEE